MRWTRLCFGLRVGEVLARSPAARAARLGCPRKDVRQAGHGAGALRAWVRPHGGHRLPPCPPIGRPWGRAHVGEDRACAPRVLAPARGDGGYARHHDEPPPSCSRRRTLARSRSTRSKRCSGRWASRSACAWIPRSSSGYALNTNARVTRSASSERCFECRPARIQTDLISSPTTEQDTRRWEWTEGRRCWRLSWMFTRVVRT